MKETRAIVSELSLTELPSIEQTQPSPPKESQTPLLKKLRGGFFFVLGYLLSPLCWWNDLLFNLPIAYAFGYICSLLSPNLLLPCSVLGYWLSNIIGILLMQAGVVDIFQAQAEERNLKKELLSGLVSSTVYTFVILALIQFKVLDTPLLLVGN